MSGTTGTLTAFTAGDLVISVVGDVENTGTLTLDQASPIYLEELTASGTVVGDMILPQATVVVNGVTEYAISGEYGSASEGSLQLSGDGQSLVIVGYGVNADAFNTGTVYGTSALGQTTSVPGGTITAVPRVIADISYNGTVDTSTALYNVFNTNNPRSVATYDGTTFYLAGQGVKGDSTQGVFYAHDGASSATAIDTSTDTRFATIYNGELYVSRDSTQSASGTNIATYGTTLPTTRTSPSVLTGIGESITLTAAQDNTVNAGAVGTSVHLSPENFFFADADTLYVADGGVPKNGGIGDGGLQKWVFNGTTWTLEYTLSLGLNLVNSTTATSGTTGLIGLTGTVVGGVVELYATNETVGELDQTYLYGITDTLSATTGAGESFTVLETAAPDTIIRGISFAPSAAAATTSVTSVTSGVTSSGVVVTSGSSLLVANGGTAVAATIMSGGSATISIGGVDSGSDIAQGGSELVLGSATGDFVDGVQIVSAATAVVSNETVFNGGTVELNLKGAVANGVTVETGGALTISGNATVNNAVISGGLIELESAKAVLAGSLTFAGAGTIEVTANTSPISSGVTFGDLAVISGFGVGDAIDFTATTSVGAAGSAATLSTTVSGGNTVATVSGGGFTETYLFAGSIGSELVLTGDGKGGEKIIFSPPPPTVTTISSGVTSSNLTVTSGSFLDILSGGTAVSATVASGGVATVEIGGIDSASTIASGGNETVFGSATGDAVSGTQLLSAPTSAASSIAVVSNETVFNGGAVDLFLKGAVANNVTVSSGGSLNINGNATANNTVIEAGGTVELQSPKATLANGLTFSGAGTLELTGISSAGFGELAVISGFGSGAVIDYTLFGAGASLSTVLSGGNTVATITSGGVSQSAIFAGSVGSNLMLTSDGAGGEEIVFTSSGGTTSSSSATSVTSGTTQSGLVVSGGMILDVLSGGTIVGATILSGGSVTVESGGVDSASIVSAGGVETVIGAASLDQVFGSQVVSGSVANETIMSGGLATVALGGTDSGSIISAGGNETVVGSASHDQVYGIQLLNAATSVVSNETVFNGGTVELFLKGAIANNLTVEAGGALLISGNATANNTVINGGLIELQSPKAVLAGSVTFDGPGTIEVTAISSAGFGDLGVISGFGAGDLIAFTSVGSGATLSTTMSGGNTVATITSGGVSQSLIFAGVEDQLGLVSSGGITEVVPCFAAGTRIATARGEIAVEDLTVGDLLPTVLGGRTRPIVWIGRRDVDCAHHAKPREVWPVRVAAGAFGPGQPHTDLFLSPDHAVFVGAVLIPVKHLINGDTIAQVSMDQVTYYHVELPQHDVVLAQGLSVESFLDIKDGANYADARGAVPLCPDYSSRIWEAYGCAPLVVIGPDFTAARERVGTFARMQTAA
ncbi:MAG: Hint domain-containing protein [Acetobacteraceae bacterium]|nr:Hint domain-containing protein [Acetobacteraceae bacterium]